jgi:predicted transcriptional regulator
MRRTHHIAVRLVLRAALRKEERDLALLKAPHKQPKTTTLQVRVEEEIRQKFDEYAEFLDANVSYVVGEALKLLFTKDAEFKRWLSQHANDHTEERSAEEIAEKA